jgi:uncharacterized protein YoxC
METTSPRTLLWSLALLISFLIGCSKGPEPLNFVVTFDDASGVQSGQFVVYKGLRIGEVKAVTLDPGGQVRVDVQVQPEYVGSVYREAEFIVEKPGGMLDVSGERQVTMNDRGTVRTAMNEGDIVQGVNGQMEQLLGRASDLADKAWTAAAAATDRTIKYIEEISTSPEAQQLKESMKQFADDASSMAEEQYEEFRTKQLPAIRKKAEELKDELERSGKIEEARRLWDKYTSWEKEAEQR